MQTPPRFNLCAAVRKGDFSSKIGSRTWGRIRFSSLTAAPDGTCCRHGRLFPASFLKKQHLSANPGEMLLKITVAEGVIRFWGNSFRWTQTALLWESGVLVRQIREGTELLGTVPLYRDCAVFDQLNEHLTNLRIKLGTEISSDLSNGIRHSHRLLVAAA